MFNELRLCAPLNVAQNVTQLMQSSLRKASSHIKSFYRQEQQALTSNEREMLTRLCQCYSYEFVPFIQRCIHAIFPPHQIAKHLGISQTQLHRMVRFFKVNFLCFVLFYFTLYVNGPSDKVRI